MSKKSRTNLIPYSIIVSAKVGDPEAINTVLKRYKGYLIELSTIKYFDEYGQEKSHINYDLLSLLEQKLACALIKDFNITE